MAFPFTWYVLSGYQEINYKVYQIAKKTCEAKSKYQNNMARMSKLSDHKFKITVVNILRTLMDKAESMQEQVGNVSRDGNPK